MYSDMIKKRSKIDSIAFLKSNFKKINVDLWHFSFQTSNQEYKLLEICTLKQFNLNTGTGTSSLRFNLMHNIRIKSFLCSTI